MGLAEDYLRSGPTRYWIIGMGIMYDSRLYIDQILTYVLSDHGLKEAVESEMQGAFPSQQLPINLATMAIKTHNWISLWFLITAPVIAWDVGYCMMRPRSMKGGDLHWIWKPYALYQEVDYIYGTSSFLSGNGFTNAQSLLNIIETLANIAYLYLAHIAQWPAAPIIGFGAALMTLSKTILYWAQEYYCGFCEIGHNKFWDLVFLWIVPNGLWIVVPAFIVLQLGKDLAESLNFAARESKKISGSKRK